MIHNVHIASLQLYNFIFKTFLMNDAKHAYYIFTTLQLNIQNFFLMNDAQLAYYIFTT